MRKEMRRRRKGQKGSFHLSGCCCSFSQSRLLTQGNENVLIFPVFYGFQVENFPMFAEY
jgi:hypothetical protein